MSTSPMPPSFESLGGRPFSFYPPIIGVEHNEWRFVRGTWSEILVANAKTEKEVWLPRRLIGELSKVEEPVAIVGLTRELEYKGGAVWPYNRRVLEMPAATPHSAPPTNEGPRSREVLSIHTEPAADTRALRLIGIALLIGIAGYLLMANVLRQGVVRPRINFTTRDQSYLELKPYDDYYAVVSKLGQPGRDRWMAESGELQYRALSYPQRAYTIVLMGTDRKTATYLGTLDDNWHPVHGVPYRGGGTSLSVLRGLKRF